MMLHVTMESSEVIASMPCHRRFVGATHHDRHSGPWQSRGLRLPVFSRSSRNAPAAWFMLSHRRSSWPSAMMRAAAGGLLPHSWPVRHR